MCRSLNIYEVSAYASPRNMLACATVAYLLYDAGSPAVGIQPGVFSHGVDLSALVLAGQFPAFQDLGCCFPTSTPQQIVSMASEMHKSPRRSLRTKSSTALGSYDMTREPIGCAKCQHG
jgi:hypothetical protein